MLVDTERMLGITELQKNLPKVIRDIEKENSPVFISKRNKISAVLMPVKEYDKLLELLEDIEIAKGIKEEMKNYNPKDNIAWDKIKQEHGL